MENLFTEELLLNTRKNNMTIDQIVNLLTLLATVLAVYFAWRIGVRQNQINERALSISDFVEIFLMPQQVILQDQSNESKTFIKWNILIKNVSSYPIYLNNFTLNGIKQDIGSSAIPSNSDSWYAVPILEDVQKRGNFSLVVSFEDYLGQKYQTEGYGIFDGTSWQIKSKKRIKII